MAQSAPVTPPTGTWRHPRFDEIAKRQSVSTFTDRNVHRLLWNGGAIIASWVLVRLLHVSAEHYDLLEPFYTNSTYPVLLLRLISLFNIIVALLPLVRPKDELADIPLTPSQRALLGLRPSGSPATPGSVYATPPKYARSVTPRSLASDGRSSSYSSSPLSGRGSPAFNKLAGGSPYSPAPSPLLHKAIAAGNRDTMRRHSFGSPSPAGGSGPGDAGSVLGAPSTPSPSNGKKPSVLLNSKWLYERGRTGSSNGRIF